MKACFGLSSIEAGDDGECCLSLARAMRRGCCARLPPPPALGHFPHGLAALPSALDARCGTWSQRLQPLA